MNIPSNTRQFGLKSALIAVTTVCISLGLFRYLPLYGFALPLAVCVFWTGMGMFVISDTIDSRPIDSRKIMAQILNVAGMGFVIFSAIALIACLILNAPIVIVFW